jgi:adenosylmethionine-8-amino-7-oxononanoate aminotransferase
MTNALLHPFSHPTKDESEYINIVRGEGVHLFDDKGRSYIDGIASLWYCQVGHGRTEITGAITKQMAELTTYNVFDPMTNPVAAEAAERIVAVSPHPDGRVFLGCSGSEAIDSAIKLTRLIQQRRGHHDKQIILRRTRGYHGTNLGGTSAQGIEGNRVGWGDLVPHFIEIPGDDLEAAATVFKEHGPNIAGVITEPVQGAGGVFTPPDGYLEGLRKLCDQHQAILTFDEVICGFGRTGSWFASQTYGVTPDLITFAKGVTSGYLPLSGVIVSRAMAGELETEGFKLMTGYTYSGHPTCAAAAIANIDLIASDGLVERANHIGVKLSQGFQAMQADEMIESYRGVGGIWAVETGRDAVPIRDELLTKGLILRGIGQALAFWPPLSISDGELDTLIETVADVLGH